MSELAQKLAKRLRNAVNYRLAGSAEAEEAWDVVAETVEVMIDKAILEFEGTLIKRLGAHEISVCGGGQVAGVGLAGSSPAHPHSETEGDV